MEHTGCENCEHDISGITFCPLHAAAPALLEALEDYTAFHHREHSDQHIKLCQRQPCRLAHAAIKAAKGD